ncbi:unnamed protein product [Blepharisma stoltei]|uniref:Uncharacterized protein n=1 Tax=Blepharisma stoltei TaxID=1481888 RepID=A0AAU9JUQ6_9CILI|nr:unnamed protein product [Blepharisma stoltei]
MIKCKWIIAVKADYFIIVKQTMNFWFYLIMLKKAFLISFFSPTRCFKLIFGILSEISSTKHYFKLKNSSCCILYNLDKE